MHVCAPYVWMVPVQIKSRHIFFYFRNRFLAPDFFSRRRGDILEKQCIGYFPKTITSGKPLKDVTHMSGFCRIDLELAFGVYPVTITYDGCFCRFATPKALLQACFDSVASCCIHDIIFLPKFQSIRQIYKNEQLLAAHKYT